MHTTCSWWGRRFRQPTALFLTFSRPRLAPTEGIGSILARVWGGKMETLDKWMQGNPGRRRRPPMLAREAFPACRASSAFKARANEKNDEPDSALRERTRWKRFRSE